MTFYYCVLPSPIPQFSSSYLKTSIQSQMDTNYSTCFFLCPDILVFNFCAVNPIAALSRSGVTLNGTIDRESKLCYGETGLKANCFNLTEILSSTTIIFNEAGLLQESWQKPVIYTSPRAMTANWANTKITCDVKSACAYHYRKTHDVLGKGPVKLSCLLMKRTVLFQTSVLYQI